MTFIQFKFVYLFIYGIAQCISLGWAILLPSVSVSMYFYTSNVVAPIEPSIGITDGNAEMTSYGGVEQRHHHQPQPQSNADGLAAQPIENQPQINSIESGHKEKSTTIEQKVSPKFSWRNAIYVLWTHFRTSYSNNVVVVWSIWWALAMAGFLQVNRTKLKAIEASSSPSAENVFPFNFSYCILNSHSNIYFIVL